MRAFSLLVVAAMALLAVATAGAMGSSVAQPSDAWEFTCVDCPKFFEDVGERSLRLDSEDHPHVAYGGDHLYYAWYDGARWIYETADSSDGVGRFAALDLGQDDQPHIAYYDSSMQRLLYASRGGSNWVIEIVDPQFPIEWNTIVSLAVDHDSRPHIIYGGDQGLKYAYRLAGSAGWQIETVVSQDTKFASIALDDNGVPHLAFGHSSVEYAARGPTGWTIETVDPHAFGEGSLALDRAGFPHISYSDAFDNEGLAYLYADTSGWHKEVVTDEPPWHTSLALDQTDTPHISYSSSSDLPNIQYAHREPGGWQVEIIDESAYGTCRYRTSVAVDQGGVVHILYHHGNEAGADGQLAYASHGEAGWLIETVDSSEAAGIGVSLAIDAGGYPHLTYLGSGLKHAYLTAAGWHLDNLDSLGGIDSSMALDATGQFHVAYIDHYANSPYLPPVELRYGRDQAAGWQNNVVDRPGSLGEQISLAISPDDRPAIAYFNIRMLCYAYQDNAGWHIDRVTPTGGLASLAFGLDGAPRIAYARYDGLAYATRSETSWQSETVVAQVIVSDGISLAIDDSGFAHVAFYRPTTYPDGDLMYAHQDSEGWHVETVDEPGNVGRAASLVVDALGTPHIAYYDATNQVLKYAHKDFDTWSIEVVDSNGDVGKYTAIALDQDGRACIGYHDATLADLKLACQRGTSS